MDKENCLSVKTDRQTDRESCLAPSVVPEKNRTLTETNQRPGWRQTSGRSIPQTDIPPAVSLGQCGQYRRQTYPQLSLWGSVVNTADRHTPSCLSGAGRSIPQTDIPPAVSLGQCGQYRRQTYPQLSLWGSVVNTADRHTPSCLSEAGRSIPTVSSTSFIRTAGWLRCRGEWVGDVYRCMGG